MNNMEWKEIPGYEGQYEVSDTGLVRSMDRIIKHSSGSLMNISGLTLSANVGNNGYLNLNLCKNGKRKNFNVHLLVAMAFLNHKPHGFKLVVDHRDNDKLNNNISNLQIITNRKNTSKDRIGKSSKYTGVYYNKKTQRYRSVIQVNGKEKYLGCFKDEKKAANAYQFHLNKVNGTVNHDIL